MKHFLLLCVTFAIFGPVPKVTADSDVRNRKANDESVKGGKRKVLEAAGRQITNQETMKSLNEEVKELLQEEARDVGDEAEPADKDGSKLMNEIQRALTEQEANEPPGNDVNGKSMERGGDKPEEEVINESMKKRQAEGVDDQTKPSDDQIEKRFVSRWSRFGSKTYQLARQMTNCRRYCRARRMRGGWCRGFSYNGYCKKTSCACDN